MSTRPVIAVAGNMPEMRQEFPLERRENAGNMIHASAPLDIFPEAVHSLSKNPPWGKSGSFREWVNKNASHLIFTLANTIRFDRTDGAPYRKILESLDSYDAELLTFGLGAQAATTQLDGLSLPDEAIELMRYLGERCKVVGVRGEFTKRVFKEFAGVYNTYAIGCPSLFAHPEAARALHTNLKDGKLGKRAYSGTKFADGPELQMLAQSVRYDEFLVEPVNHHHHRFYLESVAGSTPPAIPSHFQPLIDDGQLNYGQLVDHFKRNYRLFRSVDPWVDFNREIVSFTYGTRFHVNMASYLAGTPTMWVTHDSRTTEMVDYLGLPSITLENAKGMTPIEIEQSYSAELFFDGISKRFSEFNDYLSIFGLAAEGLTV